MAKALSDHEFRKSLFDYLTEHGMRPKRIFIEEESGEVSEISLNNNDKFPGQSSLRRDFGSLSKERGEELRREIAKDREESWD